jgi:hypothetical protein
MRRLGLHQAAGEITKLSLPQPQLRLFPLVCTKWVSLSGAAVAVQHLTLVLAAVAAVLLMVLLM